MFQIAWEQLDATDVADKLNTLIQHQLEEQEPLIAQSFTYLKIVDLDLGSVAPHVEILEVSDPPNAERTEEKHGNLSFDSRSMMSSVSAQSSILDLQSTPSIGMKLKRQSGPSGIASNSMLFAIRQQQQQQQGLVSSPLSSISMESASLQSLKREHLPTHICSMNTTHKRKKTGTGEMKQSKRRSEWWKHRVRELKRKNVNNVVTKFDLKDTETALKFVPPQPTELQEHSEDPIDVGYLLGATATRDGGVMLKLRLKYNGNAQLTIATEIAVNFPCPKFVTMPVEAKISRIVFDGILVVIYRYNEKERLDCAQVYFESDSSQTGPLKDLGLEIKMGAPLRIQHVKDEIPNPNEGGVLCDKSVIEGFIKDQAQKLLTNMIFPQMITVENLLTKDLLTREKSTINIAGKKIEV